MGIAWRREVLRRDQGDPIELCHHFICRMLRGDGSLWCGHQARLLMLLTVSLRCHQVRCSASLSDAEPWLVWLPADWLLTGYKQPWTKPARTEKCFWSPQSLGAQCDISFSTEPDNQKKLKCGSWQSWSSLSWLSTQKSGTYWQYFNILAFLSTLVKNLLLINSKPERCWKCRGEQEQHS